MARIVYSALIDNIRGSIGGTTFQANKYGYTVKAKPNMTRPWTASQVEMQGYFAQAVRAWRDASDTTRSNWESWAAVNPQYAKHNPTAQLSGYVCFVKWHAYQMLTGGAVDVSPDVSIPPVPTVALTLGVNLGVLTMSATFSDQDEFWNLAYFLSRPFGAAQSFIGTKTRYLLWGTSADDSYDISAAYAAKFGSIPSVGQRVAIDRVLFMEAGGQVNARQQIIVTVTAL